MAKYELIKRTEITGDVYYAVYKDGHYVNNSTDLNYENAKKTYERLINGLPAEPIIEILLTNEIEEPNAND